jgi:hypothetical protein
MTFFDKPLPPPKQKKDKCTIKVKRNADGGITKTIEGTCTKEQLQALASENEL